VDDMKTIVRMIPIVYFDKILSIRVNFTDEAVKFLSRIRISGPKTVLDIILSASKSLELTFCFSSQIKMNKMGKMISLKSPHFIQRDLGTSRLNP